MVRSLTPPPAAITLDLVLPDVDGWFVLEELKNDALTSAIPVIIVSMTEDRSRGMALGASEFLTKPVQGELLCRAVRSLRGPSRVLVMSEAHLILDRLTERLREAGYQLLVASDGALGLQMALNDCPDVVIIDLLLPGLRGLEVARRLKQDARTSNVPLIFFSGRELAEQDREELAREIRAVASSSSIEEMLMQLKTLLGEPGEARYRRIVQ
ncbi:MAG: hypothetical protein AMXMBFR33_12100 [Candidatus Xenobia bacterium]